MAYGSGFRRRYLDRWDTSSIARPKIRPACSHAAFLFVFGDHMLVRLPRRRLSKPSPPIPLSSNHADSVTSWMSLPARWRTPRRSPEPVLHPSPYRQRRWRLATCREHFECGAVGDGDERRQHSTAHYQHHVFGRIRQPVLADQYLQRVGRGRIDLHDQRGIQAGRGQVYLGDAERQRAGRVAATGNTGGTRQRRQAAVGACFAASLRLPTSKTHLQRSWITRGAC
jgi:hypothetical protein